MTEQRLALGRKAEKMCRRRLRRKGWRIVGANWRCRFGELDLIAIDGRTLVFVEVKSSGRQDSAGPGPERPVLAVGPGKQARLSRLAESWLASNAGRGAPLSRTTDVRFDVVGIVFAEDGSILDLEHIEDAFRVPDP